MIVSQTNGEWVQAIAQRAATDSARIESMLAAYHISATPVLPIPRRLLLTRIAFSGIKDQAGTEEPFSFDWSDLTHGLWAMLSDKNFRGKSSILEVVHWLLRGRPTSNLQEDVRRWIQKAQIRFLLDDVEHEVSIQTRNGLNGTLTRRGKKVIQLADFQNEVEFETVMADFFMRALSMDAITSWQPNTSDDEDLGRAVSHGWAAFSGAMFIGTNYETLLGDLPVATGLNPRLIQMYIGVPWVATLASSQSAFKASQNALEAQSRKVARTAESRQRREAEIGEVLTKKRNELAALPSDDDIRRSLSKLNADYATLKRQESALEKRLSNELHAEEEARNLHFADRKELQEHLDSMAAGAIFRQLDPTYCPRCDTAISAAKKKLEQSTHACSVCGEVTETDEDAETMKEGLEKRVKASKSAYDKAAKAAKALQSELVGLQEQLHALQRSIDEATSKLGSYSRQQQLNREIAVFEGRLAEAKHDSLSTSDEHEPNEMKALAAIVSETELRVKAVRNDLLKEVSDRIVHYAQRFGMHTLTGASLKANASLSRWWTARAASGFAQTGTQPR
jgi:predicted  nucleic acid-binding Zn-ribbon protein